MKTIKKRGNDGQFVRTRFTSNRCIDCEKIIGDYARRCKSCAVSLRMKGNKPSSVHKKRISETLKKKKIRPPIFKKHTEETKKKMSISHSLPENTTRINGDGHKMIKVKKKWIREHRYVWLKNSDSGIIPKGFVVHHINNNKTDNIIKNLACIPHGVHSRLHRTIEEINRGEYHES